MKDSCRNHSESSDSCMPDTSNNATPETPFPFAAKATKVKDKVKPTEELDLTDLIPTVATASSSAPPQVSLQTLLKNVTSSKKPSKSTIPIFPSHSLL